MLSREAGLDKPTDSYKSPMDLVRQRGFVPLHTAQRTHCAIRRGWLTPTRRAQLTSASHRTSLVTHDTASALWRLVRKGVAPAFATNNMKWAPPGVVLSFLFSSRMLPLGNSRMTKGTLHARKEFPRFVEIGQQVCSRVPRSCE